MPLDPQKYYSLSLENLPTPSLTVEFLCVAQDLVLALIKDSMILSTIFSFFKERTKELEVDYGFF